jgi:hypothetical protein
MSLLWRERMQTKMVKKKEDLKTTLPEQDLKESLGNLKSDLVKRLDSEPISQPEDVRGKTE